VALGRLHGAPVTTELVRKQWAGDKQENIVVNRGADVAMEKVVR
jgi:hypothetical protein